MRKCLPERLHVRLSYVPLTRGVVPPQLSVKNVRLRAGRVTVRFLSVMRMSALPPKIAHLLVSAKIPAFLDCCGDSPALRPLRAARGRFSLYPPTKPITYFL